MDTSKTILSIEDDHMISEMYSRALRKAGYIVDEVHTGTDGIAAARAKAYDAILVDIFIPEKTGLEVLYELRGEQGTGMKNTKFVILTNYAQEDDERSAVESIVEGYYIKADITPKTLVNEINALFTA